MTNKIPCVIYMTEVVSVYNVHSTMSDNIGCIEQALKPIRSRVSFKYDQCPLRYRKFMKFSKKKLYKTF